MRKVNSGMMKALPCRACEPQKIKKTNPFTFIIFGGAGDLSQRKLLPAMYHLYLDGFLPEKFSILGIGRTEYRDEIYQNLVCQSLQKFIPELHQEMITAKFASHCFYQTGDTKTDDLFQKICQRIQLLSGDESAEILFYLAVPPDLLSQIVGGLKKFQLCGHLAGSKIIVEKPFGRDRTSAHQLNQLLLDAFQENHIYRIDHYLGKETVQNILFFRFGNSMFEPLWNHKHIDHVQITVAEELGIGHRGNFYEQTGVVRDLVQNHILQLLALVAMEPPAGFDGDLIRDEKVKVYRSIRPFSDEEIISNMVRGQYGPGRINQEDVPGYRHEKNVSPQSNTPTFFAGKFFIDNWRWAGVPFYIRTGKRMKRRASEIFLQFQPPPQMLFKNATEPLIPGGLTIGIQPQEEISMQFNVKYPGMGNQPHPVNMVLNYADAFRIQNRPAYERLLLDAIKGDLTLFARMDGVEAMWGIVDPIIQKWDTIPAKDFPNYKSGTWGPKAAFTLIEKEGRQWH